MCWGSVEEDKGKISIYIYIKMNGDKSRKEWSGVTDEVFFFLVSSIGIFKNPFLSEIVNFTT